MRYRNRASAEICSSYRALKANFRHTSLPPEHLFTQDTADFIGYDQVLETTPPQFDDTTHRAEHAGVELIDGRWTQTWILVPAE